MVNESPERSGNMDVQRQIANFVERLGKATGDNLISVVLYGSAATGDFIEQRSDVNLLCVLNKTDEAVLKSVSTVVQWWSRELRHRPPMVLTMEELTTSADVFAIETLDIKAQNKLLFGRDVLNSVQVPMNLHRVQVEHELRILLLRLRQHYILARGNSDDLKKALAQSASSAATLLRHALIAINGKAPAPSRQALPKVAEVFGIDISSVNSVLDLHDGKRVESDVEKIYQDYMAALETVVQKIDRAVPKTHLQRVAQ
jgi:predicted nucleotidyltransferase